MDKRRLSIGITCYPTFGGSGVVATEIGKLLASRGHRVHFICSDVPGRLNRYLENVFFHEVEVIDYPLFQYSPYSISLASKMVEVSNFEKLDLLHVHYAVPHAASAYLAKQVLGESAPKILTTLHGTDITLVGNNRSYLPITRFAIAQSDGVTAPSQFLRNATYDKLNVSTTKPIEVIPNFVDPEIFCPLENVNCEPTEPKRHSIIKSIIGNCPVQSNIKVLVHISNFRPLKRLNDVISIFHQVNTEIDSRLILIGDGPERSTAENLARNLGIEHKVCFLGKLESFVDVLQGAHLFLLPSETESFGLAALEAMSCGLPIIATNIQGIPEVVQDGKSGYLSPVGDVKSMAANAIKLLNDADLYQQFSHNARVRALEFESNKIIRFYEDYYYRILGEN